MTISRLNATIAASGTISTELAIGGFLIAGVFIDPGMTGTSFTFEAASVSGGPYSLISDGAGSSYTKTFRAGDYLPLDPATFSGVGFLKLISGSTEGGAGPI